MPLFANQREISQRSILDCPHLILVASHYRVDGSCRCDDPTERAMMIAEWGYTDKDFPMPLRKEN